MKKRIIIAILLATLLALILGTIDSYKFFNNEKPLFILKTTQFTDGGTTFYYGPGYQLIDWNILQFDDKKQKSFYYLKKEIRIIPFLFLGYSPEKLDLKTFEIQYIQNNY